VERRRLETHYLGLCFPPLLHMSSDILSFDVFVYTKRHCTIVVSFHFSCSATFGRKLLACLLVLGLGPRLQLDTPNILFFDA
jgi:hypothetical protein